MGGSVTVLCSMALAPYPPPGNARPVPAGGDRRGRATCGGGRRYGNQRTDGRAPMPTCPCPAVGTMPISGWLILDSRVLGGWVKLTVCLDVISLVVSSCGQGSGQIE